jgi:ABC-type transport system substrate-binding protein
MKKRLFSLVLTITLIASLCTALAPAASASNLTGTITTNGVRWTLDPDAGLLTFTGGSAGWVIPNNPTGQTWYQNRHMVTRITLRGITEIGDRAFAEFVNLTHVILDNTGSNTTVITRIGNGAFAGCECRDTQQRDKYWR